MTRMSVVIFKIKIFVGMIVADWPAVSLDLYIYTTKNKYPSVKQLSWAIN